MATEVIYEPQGKAREYCERAVNLYNGCSHGCLYCYVPSATFKSREDFAKVTPRKDIVAGIEREALSNRGKEVLLCFTCDPYQHQDEQLAHTRKAIEILHNNGVKVVILTKGGKRSYRDFDLLEARPDLSKYGATLTFLTMKDSLLWEPNAASPDERMDFLREAHACGIQTWASLEPVIDPLQTLDIIELTKDFVDVFKVGRWNHDRRANLIDWRSFGKNAVELLHKIGKPYYIKHDLACELDRESKEVYHEDLKGLKGD